jgi:hypothetical protein
LPADLDGLQCLASAELTIEIENRSSFPVSATVDGELADPSATCISPDLQAYPPSQVSCPAGTTCTQPIASLRPGTWIQHLSVRVGDGISGLQEQWQRRVLAAGPSSPVNRLHWIVYPRTFLASSAGTLVQAIADATTYLASHDPSLGALVTFDWSKLPGVCATNPRTMILGNSHPCAKTASCSSPAAGYCVGASGIVLDALDRNGEPGAIVLSGASVNDPLLRICGSGNLIRGLHLTGNPDATKQRDTMILDGLAADNRLEDLIVEGPGKGDAVGAQGSGDGNRLVRADVRNAQDKGVKVTDGAQLEIADSCISANKNGGIQATRGGEATALRNLVQMNLPGAAQNGIWAFGWPLFAKSGIASPSRVRTDANVVRFNGAQGLSATDDAIALFQNDYVANNQYAGARIVSTAPCAAHGPTARFDGVAFVCNAATTATGGPQLSGTCSTSGLPCRVGSSDCAPGERCGGTAPKGLGLGVQFGSGEFGCCQGACPTPLPSSCDECQACVGACRSPAVTLGAGLNAFVAQPLVTGVKAGQLIADAAASSIDAHGNFWDALSRAVVNGPVDTAPVASAPADPPRIDAVWPSRPSRGDLVRVWGAGFDALAATRTAGCATTTPPADACDPSNSTIDGAANTVSLRLADTSIPADVVAVTPTMLAFRMPADCFAADAELVVARGGVASAAWPICEAPPDCLGAADGELCEPDGLPCTVDACRAGVCTHDLVPAGIVCRAAVGDCDVPETCDGINSECPDDGVAPTSVVCRPATGACDLAETCDGTTAACPPDAMTPAGTICRPPVGPCDAAEHCTGDSPACPDNALSTGTVCRPAAGACDTPEVCAGDTPACPPDRLQLAGTVCRPAVDICDAAEFCTGSSVACPADTRIPGCTTTTSTTVTTTTTSTTVNTSTSSTTAGRATTTSTTTTTTAPTSTTEPCADVRSTFDAAMGTGACADETIPRALRRKLTTAASLLGQTGGSRTKKTKRQRRHALMKLKEATQALKKARRGRHPKLSRECATSVQTAIDAARHGAPPCPASLR